MSMNLGGGVDWVDDRHSNSNDTHGTVVTGGLAATHTPVDIPACGISEIGRNPQQVVPSPRVSMFSSGQRAQQYFLLRGGWEEDRPKRGKIPIPRAHEERVSHVAKGN